MIEARASEMRTAASVQPLSRRLGLAGVLFLTLSVATPASSLFVIVPGMLQTAGTGALIAMAIGGLVCVGTAYIYAELSSAWPSAGGEYVMVAHTLGPAAGFVMLGVNVFNNLLFPPVAALGISALLSSIIPNLSPIATAVGALTMATLVSILTIRVNARITGVFLLVEVAALATVAVIGLAHARLSIPWMVIHPSSPTARGLVPASRSSIAVATTIAIFALNGYGVAVYFAEEMHDARRKIASAVLMAFVLSLLLEIMPLAASLSGSRDLVGFLRSDDPFGTFVRTSSGDFVANLVAVGVVIAIFNALIAAILANARFFYGTGRDRSWGSPVDTWMTAIHPRWGSPWLGTVLVGAVGIGCCFFPLSFLLVLSGAGLLVIYAGIAIAALLGRRSDVGQRSHYRMPLFPLWPLLTLGALLYVTWSDWLDPDAGRPALIATGLQGILALLFYRLVVVRRGKWVVHVPEAADAGRLVGPEH